jgi:hypothetical protein
MGLQKELAMKHSLEILLGQVQQYVGSNKGKNERDENKEEQDLKTAYYPEADKGGQILAFSLLKTRLIYRDSALLLRYQNGLKQAIPKQQFLGERFGFKLCSIKAVLTSFVW